MTSLLFTLTVIGLITLCVLIGKYNKSDNLALILVMALLAGMAGGAIVNKLNTVNKKENGCMQIKSSTQSSTTSCGDLYTPSFSPVVCGGEYHHPKFVTKNVKISVRDIQSFAPSKRNGEIRAQPLNSSMIRGGPNTLYDTS